MSHSDLPDPFQNIREKDGIHQIDDQGDPVLMVLRYKDVRKCAHDWQTFQSAARPGRIVVPSEVHIRTTRQIPFEVDPPEHKAYRDLIEAWFRRPLQSDYEDQLRSQIEALVEEVLQKDSIEVVEEFSLRLQSHALTLLLDIPISEAKTWISWGTLVFRSEETKLDSAKANILYDYIDAQIDKAIENPGTDLYSLLLAADFQGRKLTKEEIKGVMILTFAGGRDTIINYVTNTIAYLAEHNHALHQLRKEPEIISRTVEELVRYFSPLTHMGRVSTESTAVCDHMVKADSRISLCWASANRDPNIFDRPNEVILDRKINPHLAFGFGHHKCLGAHHARQIMKVLLQTLQAKVQQIKILESEGNVENWGVFDRKVGFDRLLVKFEG